MRLRRCTVLLLEPRETLQFDFDELLAGGSGLGRSCRWIALAPHLDAEVEVDAEQRELLGAISATHWVARTELEARHRASAIDALLDAGLLLGDAPPHATHRARDERLQRQHWRPAAAVAHYFSRWTGVDAVQTPFDAGPLPEDVRRAQLGPPPPPYRHAPGPGPALSLPRVLPQAFERGLARRATCRNFDPAATLDHERFARLMHVVFGVQAAVEFAPLGIALKKTSPSGGGLHPTEAWLLVQRVEGVAPGLYHYDPGAHALQPVTAAPATGPDRLQALATRFVAGQTWFAQAHVLVVLAPRFLRSFWKYRNHAKAYRALVLDAGHLSQTLYLTATELGLGAFVTSAINEVDVEQAFGMDSMQEGALAICGFGPRSAIQETAEFDPSGAVWPAPG